MENTFLRGLIEGLTTEATATATAEDEVPAWKQKFISNFTSEQEKKAEATPQAPASPMAAIRSKLGLDKEAAATSAPELSLMDKLREKLGMTKEAKEKEEDEKKAKAEGKKKEKEKEDEEENEKEKEASASNIFEIWKARR